MALTTTENIEDIYELSPMQLGMLFHTIYAPGSGIYFEQSSVPIKGVNVPAFERAWQEVIDRQPVLRTSFYWEDLEKPLQVVHRDVKLPMDQQDWREFSPSDQKNLLASYLKANQSQGFDLAEPPLLRLSLLRLTDDTYQFILNFHHILLDGWSKDLVMKEVLECYEAFCVGKNPRLVPRRPYSEYIAWLQQQSLPEAAAYWTRMLKGFTEPTRIGVTRGMAAEVDQEEFDELQTRVPKSVTASLQAMAREHQVTLNAIVQGAWGLLLKHYSGRQDILFGTIVSGRPPQLEDVESIVGLFINALPVRLHISPDCTVAAYVKELQKQQAEMRQYEYSPLFRVQGWSEIPKGVPLFESLLVFENYPGSAAPEEPGSPAHANISYFERTNYPLTILIAPGEQMWVKVLYSKRQFDGPTMERMLQHYTRILEQFASQPHGRLSDLELMTDAERNLIRNLGAGSPAPAAATCVHHLFEAQVARTPHAIAVIDAGKQFTYADIDVRANGLAQQLRGLGIKTETRVGVCLPRSIQMLTAVLAILKAGGTYVPLDPSYPDERLRWMIENSDLKLIITAGGVLSKDTSPGVRRLEPDEKYGPTDGPAPSTDPDNMAYVLYTSGSTGRPKGVAMSHRALHNLITWQCEQFKTVAGVRVLQFAPLSFDVSFQEIFSTWCSGGTIVVMPEEARGDPFYLSRFLQEQSIERLFMPFVALQQLAEANKDRPVFFSSLREIITAGEQLQITPAIIDFFRRHPHCVLYNHYGPTETHVVTAYELTASPDSWPLLPPIGRPIAAQQTYLLDTQMRLVPMGITAELYLGGTGLARGYLNSPNLTAERFLPDPFSAEPGRRLYRTGDLARYLSDGQLEFLGRIDDQVKIRGYRIELGEIEAALTRHNAVEGAVVSIHGDGAGQKRLIAYVVARDSREIDRADLRKQLQRILPEYMIPSVFMQVQNFPLTPSGKIDRRKLPAPEVALTRDYVEPQTEIEEELAAIWADVLGVEKVGVHENFFELGGHSLLATQMLSRVRNAFQLEFPLRLIFQAPTIAELAAVVEDMLITTLENVPESEVQALSHRNSF